MGKHEKIEEEQLYKNLNNELRSARNIKEISLITRKTKNTIAVQAHRGLEKLKLLYSPI